MGNSTKTKGGKGAPVPVSMHPTKGGGHPTAGMADRRKRRRQIQRRGTAASASELPIVSVDCGVTLCPLT